MPGVVAPTRRTAVASSMRHSYQPVRAGDRFAAAGRLVGAEGDLHRLEAVLAGDERRGVVLHGVDEGTDHLRVAAGDGRDEGVGRPLRLDDLDVVVEGVE